MWVTVVMKEGSRETETMEGGENAVTLLSISAFYSWVVPCHTDTSRAPSTHSLRKNLQPAINLTLATLFL